MGKVRDATSTQAAFRASSREADALSRHARYDERDAPPVRWPTAGVSCPGHLHVEAGSRLVVAPDRPRRAHAGFHASFACIICSTPIVNAAVRCGPTESRSEHHRIGRQSGDEAVLADNLEPISLTTLRLPTRTRNLSFRFFIVLLVALSDKGQNERRRTLDPEICREIVRHRSRLRWAFMMALSRCRAASTKCRNLAIDPWRRRKPRSPCRPRRAKRTRQSSDAPLGV